MSQANKIYERVAVTLVTLLDDDGKPLSDVPESVLYLLVCDANLGEWNEIKAVMLRGGLIEIKFNAVSLTPKGAELAAKLDAEFKAHRARQKTGS